jgi:NAD(P)-dependent dehydrogenase (short-subunit alcohol dehydrogenase family)
VAALADRVCLVTGAASGIGRSIARKAAEEGGTVIAVDLDEAGLGKLAAEFGCEVVVADVSSQDGQAAILERERIDVLFNNAGILDALTPLLQTDDDLYDRVMRVNARAPFQLTRALLPGMIERGGGAVVNTCSAASLSGGRAGFAYTASKHALLGMTRSVAWYYADQGIRCNAVAPGAIQTKIQFRAPPDPGGMARVGKYLPTIPPQGRAMQVAECAVFLASDAASYVNGEVLTVDGGWNSY